MRAVITGGAGFLGSHLCELMLEKGWDVLCLDNLVTGNQSNVAHLIPHLVFVSPIKTFRVTSKCRARWRPYFILLLQRALRTI